MLRAGVTLAIGLAAALFGFAVGLGLSGSAVVAVPIATLAAGLVGLWVWRRLERWCCSNAGGGSPAARSSRS